MYLDLMKLKKTFIIAEIGVNHNGKLKKAKKLIDVAKRAGADAVKFQTFTADKLANKNTKKVNYQKINTDKKENHYQMLKKLELSRDDTKKLFNYAKKIKIIFLSTPYDPDSAIFLDKIGVKIFKTASADLSDYILHKTLAKFNKQVIISTGMSNIIDIKKCLNNYKSKKKISLLHCVSNYPCSAGSINLNVLDALKKEFKMPIGYSDHSLENIASISAVAKGYKILERHLTLNKFQKGPDHKSSLDPKEFKEFIREIRLVEKVLGNSIKKCQPEEKEMKKISSKSLYFNKDMSIGDKINEHDLLAKRPSGGISPSEIGKVINKKLLSNVKKGNQLSIKNFKK